MANALARHGRPEIFNSDQGVQFTSAAFTGILEREGIAISMDGRGRALDSVFVERLWRTVKYEEVYLSRYRDGQEARQGLSRYFPFYNQQRSHQSLDYLTPVAVYFGLKEYDREQLALRRWGGCGKIEELEREARQNRSHERAFCLALTR